MTIREKQIREILADKGLDQTTRKALWDALRGIFNAEFHTEIKKIERTVKI